MTRYLTCYDYGMGGCWLYIEAESAEQIRSKYRELIVLEAPPPWWTPELEAVVSEATTADPFYRQWLKQFER